MDNLNNIFREKLKELQRELSLNLTEFASSLGTSPTSINNITKGTTYPQINFFLNLLKSNPEVDIRYLLQGEAQLFRNQSLEHFIAEFDLHGIDEIYLVKATDEIGYEVNSRLFLKKIDLQEAYLYEQLFWLDDDRLQLITKQNAAEATNQPMYRLVGHFQLAQSGSTIDSEDLAKRVKQIEDYLLEYTNFKKG